MSWPQDRWFIYVLRDPRTGEIRYVGKASDPATRLKNHRKAAKHHRFHAARWVESLRKLGLSPVMEVIDAGCGDGHRAAECAWIAEHLRRGARLTNTSPGGAGRRGPHKPETIEKIRLSKIGKKHTTESKANMAAAQLGRKQTPETIAKSRLARTGLKRSPEICAAIGDMKRGKTLSPEHVAKITAHLHGQISSPETRAKISAANLGRKRSEATREKMAAAKRGKPWSEEMRAAMTAAHAAKRARKTQQNADPREDRDPVEGPEG